MTDRTITLSDELLLGHSVKNVQKTVRVLGGLLVWISGVGVAVYAAGILFTQSAFAGRWVVIWLALGWVVALVVLRMRLERRLVEIRRNEMQPMRGSE